MRILTLFMALAFTISSKAQLVIDRCDITNSWTSANQLTRDVEDAKEGRASISMTGDQSEWFSKVFVQRYTGVSEDGFLSFSLFISDVGQLASGGYVEVNSSGETGVDAYQWSLNAVGLISGWNDLQLQLAAATKSGSPDLNAIRQFKIFQPVSGSVTAKLDFIMFDTSDSGLDSDKILNVKKVDNNTLDGKVMFGYQGWFSAKGDGGPLSDRWHHWGDLTPGDGDPGRLSIEMWFDDRDFDPDELYKTGYFYPDGREARAFSSYNKKTVIRHMKWIRDYNIDGVFLQRFMSEARDPKFKEFRDSVAIHVMQGSERYGRTFAMMWDGVNYANAADDIIEDWKHLVDDLKLTESPNYLHHRGRPLISLWGYTVRETATIEDLNKLIDFFHNSPEEKYRASIKLGCNNDWKTRDNGKWLEAFRQVEVISPWAVGRYGSSRSSYENFADGKTVPDLEWCDENNIDYMPVNWPGFSWFNLHNGPKNQHPRRQGDFFWEQASGNLSRGSNMLYIAMFDEIDEATAFFKLPENAAQSPTKGYWLDLSADGGEIPGDWYLRSVGLVKDVMNGEKDNRYELGVPDDGLDVFSVRAEHATCDGANGKLILNYPSNEGSFEFSIDGGKSYDYASDDTKTQIEVDGLQEGLYDIWVRYADGSYPTDIGDRLIMNAEVELFVSSTDATCRDDGQISLQLVTNPYVGPVDISLDGGTTYALTLEEGVYSVDVESLAPGTYEIWAKWQGSTCGNEIQNVVIDATLAQPEITVELFDEVYSGEICQGSHVALRASANTAVSSWAWTGPEGFTAEGSYVELSENFSSANSGTYTATYTDANNCNASQQVVLESSSAAIPEINWIVEVEGAGIDPDTSEICEGNRLILEGLPQNNNYEYEWTGPNGFYKTGRRATLAAIGSTENNGTYFLRVTEGDCFNKVTKEIVISSDACEDELVLEANDSNKFMIYPNPNMGRLNINLKDGSFKTIKLIDMTGREFPIKVINMAGDTVVIETSGLNKGIYELVVQLNNGKVISKRLQKL